VIPEKLKIAQTMGADVVIDTKSNDLVKAGKIPFLASFLPPLLCCCLFCASSCW
jgi:hypothetical protein